MKYHTKLTFKIYWQHAKRYKLAMLGVILGISIGDGFSIAVPYLYKNFFDTLVAHPEMNALLKIILTVFVLSLCHWLFVRAAAFFNSYLQTNVMRDLANTCFAYLHKHSFSFFNNNFVGSLVKKVGRFYRAFEGVAERLTWDLLPILVNVGLIIVVLGTRQIVLALIVIVWIVVFCLVNYFFTKYKLKYDVERAELDSKTTGLLADTITNYGNVKMFGGYEREREKFADINYRLNKLRRFSWDLGNVFDSVQWLLMLLLEVGMMYAALVLWNRGMLTVGDFVLIQAYLARIFEKLWGFGRVIRNFYEHLADAEEMAEIFDTPHEIVDVKNAKKLIVKKGEIKFNQVTFCYHKTRKVLDEFDLTIKHGERVALVGPSGAGKTTVIKLLLRNHEATGGAILIDNQDVRQVTQESLWKNISLVPQDPMLFHRPLLENIRYGKPEATDEEVSKAAKFANCDGFIRELPHGFDTYVGERGIKLSGGERQRVAIARAILRDAPILVLDEATSSLDSESEMLIQDALERLMKNKTVIVIAHRLSTIMKMDRILVIDGGNIIEQGNHQELLKKKRGLYRRLWKVQAGGFLA